MVSCLIGLVPFFTFLFWNALSGIFLIQSLTRTPYLHECKSSSLFRPASCVPHPPSPTAVTPGNVATPNGRGPTCCCGCWGWSRSREPRQTCGQRLGPPGFPSSWFYGVGRFRPRLPRRYRWYRAGRGSPHGGRLSGHGTRGRRQSCRAHSVRVAQRRADARTTGMRKG